MSIFSQGSNLLVFNLLHALFCIVAIGFIAIAIILTTYIIVSLLLAIHKTIKRNKK